MIFSTDADFIETSEAITAHYFRDESLYIEELLASLPSDAEINSAIQDRAKAIVTSLREFDQSQKGVINFFRYYNLSTEEGIILMSLAESLLRIPDSETVGLLLREKLTSANWQRHLKSSDSALVDIATRALVMTKGMLKERNASVFSRAWSGLMQRLGEPVIKTAVKHAIEMLSHYFVIGSTIEKSISKAKADRKKGIGFSYDMLGEAAKTADDADVYFTKYLAAIRAIAADTHSKTASEGAQGISVKLSALHPRYEITQQAVCIPKLTERLLVLAQEACAAGISLTVDAEESDRLDMSLEIFRRVLTNPTLDASWGGLGLAVQAYSKRALPVLSWVVEQAKLASRRVEVRLVKGAYWDTEIKLSQMHGESDYSLFTRKENTDVSYLACAEYMLTQSAVISSIFATHNAYTLAYIIERYQQLNVKKPAFQVLQGMGAGVMEVLSEESCGIHFERMVYAPVGDHAELLPYLVRRLLENGVNSSFVNQLSDVSISVDRLVESPVSVVRQRQAEGTISILEKPADIFAPKRDNSPGLCLAHCAEMRALRQEFEQYAGVSWQAGYLGSLPEYKAVKITQVSCPFDPERHIGELHWTTPERAVDALGAAATAYEGWAARPIDERAVCLENLAQLLREHRTELLYLLVHEGGKVIQDAIAELREAEDFCRYYAMMARESLAPKRMPGYTGETNELRYVGRGVVLCISPWNFPAAIFLGQVVAALVAGNTVLAKPAAVTSLIATRITALAYEAGIPKDCLHLLCGSGSQIGNACVPDDRVAAVVFTGSTEVAKGINQQLAARDGAIVPLVAETGGLNALIADTSALNEQLITDVVESAFGSSGQRCSALRLFLVPEETAESVLTMLKGAMQEWVVGSPRELGTDGGPLIDQGCADAINADIKELDKNAVQVARSPVTAESAKGAFVIPACYEISAVSDLKKEIFGPVLHVVRYKMKDLDQVVDQINQLGYGLTFGVHSRVGARVKSICDSIHIGNIYINRNITGAVVGVNPFGGSGLSGTGPKAGGPNYLTRLCHEVTVTNNVTALGGNIELIQSLTD